MLSLFTHEAYELQFYLDKYCTKYICFWAVLTKLDINCVCESEHLFYVYVYP